MEEGIHVDATDQDQTVLEASTPAEGNDQQKDQKPQGPGWRAGLPVDIRDNEAFQGFKTVGEFAKNYLDQGEKLKRAVMIPGDDATDEEREAFRAAVGLPDKPEGYTFKAELPKDMLGAKEFNKFMQNLAFENGLLPRQAEAIRVKMAELYGRGMSQVYQNREQQRKQAIEAMQKAYGPEADKKLESARRTVQQLGGDEFAQYLNETGLGNDPRAIKMFVKLSELISEDSLISGSVQGASAGNRKPRLEYPWMREEYGEPSD